MHDSLCVLRLMCRLSGTIDRTVGQARALSVLMLQDNQLTGSIHESFWTLRRVNILDLHNNQLTGTIGSEIGWVHYCASTFGNVCSRLIVCTTAPHDRAPCDQ